MFIDTHEQAQRLIFSLSNFEVFDPFELLRLRKTPFRDCSGHPCKPVLKCIVINDDKKFVASSENMVIIL